MKRGQFSYSNGHAQSHASLGRFRQQTQESRADSISRQIMYSKPNVKYYSNNDASKVAKKSTSKSEEQLRTRNRQLEYELKKKITDNCYLVKLFKTKNTSDISHLDIYLELRALEETLSSKEKMIEEQKHRLKDAEDKIEVASREIEDLLQAKEDLLQAKEEQEALHTNEVEAFSEQVDEYKRKCEFELAEKDKRIMQERKMREEKDALLKEIKRHYEETRQAKSQIEGLLEQERLSKERSKAEGTGERQALVEEHRKRVMELQDEIQKYCVRNEEKGEIIQELSQKCKDLSSLKLQAEQEMKGIAQKLSQKCQECLDYQQECDALKQKVEELQQAIESSEQTTSIEGNKLKRRVEEQARQMLRHEEDKRKFSVELGRLQHELSESMARIKILSYQVEERDSKLEKLHEKMAKENSETAHTIEQLEDKLFASEKRAGAAFDRLKEYEKEERQHKERHETVTGKQIEHYKAMGRLTELTHHLRSLSAEEVPKNRTFGLKGLNAEEPKSITQCVDLLAQSLQVFLKQEHFPMLELSKESNERLDEALCNMKSIFHAYNSYIQDEQLTGITREFVEACQETQVRSRKERSSYLQLILERLISMTAIKSYTSERGIERNKGQYQSYGQRPSLHDSLENTLRHNEEQEFEYTGRMQRQNSSKVITNPRYERQPRLSKAKPNHLKVHTNPDEKLGMAKKLEYEKENFMHRINRRDNKNQFDGGSQYNSANGIGGKGEEEAQLYRQRRVDEEEQGVGRLVKGESLRRFQKLKTEHSSLSELQKKYYR